MTNRFFKMKLLQDYASPLPKLLKDQQVREDESYRLIRYVVQQPVDNGVLLYNVLTKALALLSSEDTQKMVEDPSKVPGLVAKWFAVPIGFDDRQFVHQVRAIANTLKKHVKGYNSYTILSTTDCNARCFYCYEKGRSRIHMSDETAVSTADYIIKNSYGEKVKLRWFGGEPLYNKKAITRICSLLKEAGVEYRSTMVSNGFLFDEETVNEAVNEWKLEKVQITLDGTENTYNRIKGFIYPEDNAFRRVLGNIHRLVGAGVKVVIRLNIDRHNADDLLVLADQLIDAFSGNKLVKVYSHSLFEACVPGAAVKHSDEQRKELFGKQLKLQARLLDSGLSRIGKLSHDLKLNRCMADNDGSVVILPDGHVGKCEHFSESDWFAHVSEEGRDESVIAGFKVLRPEIEACIECPVYPDCFRLAKCEEAVHCYPEEQEERIRNIRHQMLEFYDFLPKLDNLII